MDASGVSTQIIFLVILLGCSAFFSTSETAIFSMNKLKLKCLVENKHKKAILLSSMLEDADKVLTSILIMNNLVNISTSSIATAISYDLFGSIGIGIATGVVTIFVLFFGEIIPKTFAMNNAETIALIVAPIIKIFCVVLSPIIKLFGFVSRTFAKKSNNVGALTEEELKLIVEDSEDKGVLNNTTKEMINNVFDFNDLMIKDIMIPRVNMVVINVNSSYQEIISVIKKEKFSRIPIYEDSIDNCIGILNVKDLILNDCDEDTFDIRKYIRPCHRSFEFKTSSDLFKELKKEKQHMSIISDEYGSVVGLVTIENLIEEIVGDIDDEYDNSEDKSILKIEQNGYVILGATRLDEINDSLNLNLIAGECDSIGGYLIENFNRFPKNKETFSTDNMVFTILETDKRTIKKVQLKIN